MAGFDEAALQRLEHLAGKSKAGTRLSATEAIEIKELKLLRSAAEISKGWAKIAVAKRKIEDNEKYRIGGLAVTAKLNGWPEDVLRAGFLMLATMSQDEKAALTERSRPQASPPRAAALPLRVSFQVPPGEAITTALKKRGFKWNGSAWGGTGDLADVRAEAELAGGLVELV